MQKAIYYRSRLLASRGVIELTDRNLNFQVSSLDSSFGMKNLSIDICSISEVTIAGGNVHPSVVVIAGEKRYEFVLSKASELYDKLKALKDDPLNSVSNVGLESSRCPCGKVISSEYTYCPWCGSKI